MKNSVFQMCSKHYFSFRYVVLLLVIAFDLAFQWVSGGECSGPVFQAGWFKATQGRTQHVDIEGLIGDRFCVKQRTDQNLLLGLGYFFNGLSACRTKILYGVQAFYLAPTEVRGNVTQEDLFTNLSYRYSRTNYPIFLAGRALVQCFEGQNLVFDAGLGPNIIYTSGFKEHSLDGGVTIPDAHLFSGKTVVDFSATAGLGWRVEKCFGCFSFEVNYRFFYLGKGELKKNNSQLRNTLRTGNSYANAVIFSFTM